MLRRFRMRHLQIARMAAALAAIAAGTLIPSTTATAGAYSPRIVSEHVPDTFSLADYRSYPAWRNLTSQELALAAWKAFVDNETGVAHYHRPSAIALSRLMSVPRKPQTMSGPWFRASIDCSHAKFQPRRISPAHKARSKKMRERTRSEKRMRWLSLTIACFPPLNESKNRSCEKMQKVPATRE